MDGTKLRYPLSTKYQYEMAHVQIVYYLYHSIKKAFVCRLSDSGVELRCYENKLISRIYGKNFF